jgi:hypothetical protein
MNRIETNLGDNTVKSHKSLIKKIVAVSYCFQDKVDNIKNSPRSIQVIKLVSIFKQVEIEKN